MKRIVLMFLYSAISMYSATTISFAQSSGTTDELTWNFNNEAGVLTISGEGAMPNYNVTHTWEHLHDFITKVVTVVFKKFIIIIK